MAGIRIQTTHVGSLPGPPDFDATALHDDGWRSNHLHADALIDSAVAGKRKARSERRIAVVTVGQIRRADLLEAERRRRHGHHSRIRGTKRDEAADFDVISLRGERNAALANGWQADDELCGCAAGENAK